MCIYISKDVKVTNVNNSTLNSSEIEQVWCVIHHGEDKVLVGCMYRPPNSCLNEPHSVNQAVINSLKEARLVRKNLDCSSILVFGDLNYPHIRYEAVDVGGGTATRGYTVETGSRSDESFLNALEDNHLTQMVTFPTFSDTDQSVATNTLDLVLTDEPERIIGLEKDHPLGHTPAGRAHVMLKWTFITASSRGANYKTQPRPLWSKANYAAISEMLNAHDWVTEFNSMTANDCFVSFLEAYQSACAKHIPMTTVVSREKDSPWATPAVLKVIDEKRVAWWKHVSAGIMNKSKTLVAYRKARKLAFKVCKVAKMQYEEDIVDRARRDPKLLYSYVRRRQATPDRIHGLKDTAGKLNMDDNAICRILNSSFQSVFTQEPQGELPSFPDRSGMAPFKLDTRSMFETHDIEKRLEALDENKAIGPDDVHPRVLKNCAEAMARPLEQIYRRSLADRRTPELFKLANVKPIFKSGDKHDPANYRPISLTSIVCKVMEGIIREYMMGHLLSSNQLSGDQHGFLNKKSCVTNLLETYDIMSAAMEQGLPVDVIYTDFSKAFDTVPHRRLLLKLSAYGFKGEILEWIRDWLSNRKQRVKLGEHTSEWCQVTSGVPQGSVLGPLLFVVFINDLPDEMNHKMKMYADDSKIIGVIKSFDDQRALQDDIDRGVKWSSIWLMHFNVKKCKVMHVGKCNKKRSAHVYTMNDSNGVTQELQETVLERDLGVLISNDLKWRPQVEAAASRANRVHGIFKRVFQCRSPRLWQTLYKTYIRPHLEFAIQAWSPYLEKDIQVLEKVQRRVTKHIQGLSSLSYDERLRVLGWTSLRLRRERGDAILAFQHLHGNVEVELDWQWLLPTGDGIRANDAPRIAMPPPTHNCQQRENFFSLRVARIWRTLPHKIVNSISLNKFKNAYDKQNR